MKLPEMATVLELLKLDGLFQAGHPYVLVVWPNEDESLVMHHIADPDDPSAFDGTAPILKDAIFAIQSKMSHASSDTASSTVYPRIDIDIEDADNASLQIYGEDGFAVFVPLDTHDLEHLAAEIDGAISCITDLREQAARVEVGA